MGRGESSGPLRFTGRLRHGIDAQRESDVENRLIEIMALAEAGDEDVVLQIQSEIALMPETAEQKYEREVAYAEELADSFAPVAAPVSQAELDKLAEDADF